MEKEQKRKKINLGCGNAICNPDIYINHDRIKHRKEIIEVFDLNEKDWYLKARAEMYNEIRAFDVLEHLDDPLNFMNSCWELLEKDGILDLKVCGWQNPNFYVDITHKKAYDIRSFDYFDPTTELGKEYSYYSEKKWKILKKNLDRRNNILINLSPIK